MYCLLALFYVSQDTVLPQIIHHLYVSSDLGLPDCQSDIPKISHME